MAQTKAGAIKSAAKKKGMSVAEYKLMLANGKKWCTGCKDWHPKGVFGKDSTRLDGLVPSCREYRNKRARELYEIIPLDRRIKPGPTRIERRDGDKKQARARINADVRLGQRPNPNDVPCVDCGHMGDDRRHEYDHYLGYEAKHHYDVEVTCSKCHHIRADERGESNNFGKR